MPSWMQRLHCFAAHLKPHAFQSFFHVLLLLEHLKSAIASPFLPHCRRNYVAECCTQSMARTVWLVQAAVKVMVEQDLVLVYCLFNGAEQLLCRLFGSNLHATCCVSVRYLQIVQTRDALMADTVATTLMWRICMV